jgi:hypothetical protein
MTEERERVDTNWWKWEARLFLLAAVGRGGISGIKKWGR